MRLRPPLCAIRWGGCAAQPHGHSSLPAPQDPIPAPQAVHTLLRTPRPRGCSPPVSPPCAGGAGGALTSSRSRTTSVLPHSAASCRAVPALVCRLMSMPACSRSLRAHGGVSGVGGGTGPALSPLPTAPGTHRMMSMWPFLAARCKGLVPLGSVVSPGLGSSSAAHMLLFRSSWTTWISKHRRSRAAKTAQPPAGAAGPHAQTPALRPATPWDVGAGGVPLLPSLKPPCAHPRVPLTPRASPGTPHSPSCL